MAIVVTAILAGAWAAALLWPWLRKRSDVQPSSSIASFRNQIITLERATPATYRGGSGLSGNLGGGLTGGMGGGHRYVPITHSMAPSKPLSFPMPRTPAEVRRRRRDVLLGLLGFDVFAMFLLAIGVGAVALGLFVVALALTISYLILLVQVARLSAERRQKVRSLPPLPQNEPVFESTSISS